MAPAGRGGMKGFYRQTKKIKGGGVPKTSATTTKRSKNKPQQCTKDESHGEDQEEEELRLFDMDMAYGPCIGVTRLRRWERAAAMGLCPPPHLRDLLLLHRAPATSSSLPKSQPRNSADSFRSSSTSLQLECIWAAKI